MVTFNHWAKRPAEELAGLPFWGVTLHSCLEDCGHGAGRRGVPIEPWRTHSLLPK
jgi:hypothetical protein